MPLDPTLNQRAHALIQPLSKPHYTIDVTLRDLEGHLAGLDRDWGLNLDPDFQRGHVWTPAQRQAFVEGIFNNTVTSNQIVIQFNAPHWIDEPKDSDLPLELQIVDGLQRLTTMRKFMAGEIEPFGLSFNELTQTDFDPRRYSYGLKFSVHTFHKRADLLDFYLKINTGGTVHSPEEVNRVRALRDAALRYQPPDQHRPAG